MTGRLSHPNRTGEVIDRLITVETRSPRYLSDTPTQQLYEAAVKAVGGPLTLAAASGLMEAVKPNDFVIISAGFAVPPWIPRSETDGPPAVVGSARSFSVGLKARNVLLTEEAVVPILKAGCIAAGLNPFPLDTLKKNPNAGHIANGVSIQSFPTNEKDAEEEAGKLLDDLKPAAIMTIEKCGPNEKGVYHTGFGNDMSKHCAKLHYLIDKARKRGIFTIGCLDLGNEIGSGKIRETVKRVARKGSKCLCPCQEGIACVTETDVPMVASNSAWGAYGVLAVLAGLLDDLRVLHDATLEKRLLEACIKEGMVDATTLAPTLTLSGTHVDDYGHLLELMRVIIRDAGYTYSPLELRK